MSHPIYNAITNVSDDLVDEAIATNLRPKRTHWHQYAALAACLAVALSVGSHLLPFDFNMEKSESRAPSTAVPETAPESTAPESEKSEVTEDTAQVYRKEDPQTITLSLVAWQDEGFRGVVETGNQLFPTGAELTVFFDEDTEITSDGETHLSYTADTPNAEEFGWPEDTAVTVTFHNYEAYQAENGFYNRVYATSVAVN